MRMWWHSVKPASERWCKFDNVPPKGKIPRIRILLPIIARGPVESSLYCRPVQWDEPVIRNSFLTADGSCRGDRG